MNGWVFLMSVAVSGVTFAAEDARLVYVYPSDLVFSSNRTGDMEIYLAPADGGEPENLTNSPETDNWPVWSPDGKRIAFQSRRNGAFDIYVMDADGANLQRLTEHPDHDYLPSWTPDGKHITFVSWRREEGDAERQNHVYIMNSDGTGKRRFIEETPGTSSSLEWSPDGQRAVMSWRRRESTDLRLLDGTGKPVAWLTGPDTSNEGSPAFSPGGKRVAFYSEGEDVSRIEVISIDGMKREKMWGAGRNYYPRWSPDGCWLLWSRIVGPGEDDIDIHARRLIERPPGDASVIVRTMRLNGRGRDAEASWRPRQGEGAITCH